jgi:hypothetical protein
LSWYVDVDSLQGNEKSKNVNKKQHKKKTMPNPKPCSKKAVAEEEKTSRKQLQEITALSLQLKSVVCHLESKPKHTIWITTYFIHSVYNDKVDQLCKIEVYVPTLPKECFVPDVAIEGKMHLK